MGRRHDDDAGGDAGLLQDKAALRARTWDALDVAGVRRFPGPHGRIPNFVGAEAAAERLRTTEAWQRARTCKANPDSPQWPVRQRALEDAKLLYMAVPRLREPDPFFVLDPEALPDTPRRASSIAGASAAGTTIPLEGLDPVDLIVTGCVAVGIDGVRLGKGGGFSDLEFAVASAAGLLGPGTLVATTVHPAQVLDAGEVPAARHDVLVDLIVSPEEIVHVTHRRPRAVGELLWDELTEEKIAAIPLLQRLRDEGPQAGR